MNSNSIDSHLIEKNALDLKLGHFLTKRAGLQAILQAGDAITTDKHEFICSFLRVVCKFGDLKDLYKVAVASVISRTEVPELLFRSDGFPTAVLVQYCKVCLAPCLQKIVTNIIAQTNPFLLSQARACSDPALKSDGVPLSQARINVVDWIKNLLRQICSAVLQSNLEGLFHAIYQQSNNAFELAHPHDGVGGLLFLCTICPCLAAPVSHLDVPPFEPEVKSLLMLATKLIQKAANHTEFNIGQPHLVPFNELFVSAKDVKGLLIRFFTQLCVSSRISNTQTNLSTLWNPSDTRRCALAVVPYRKYLRCIGLERAFKTFVETEEIAAVKACADTDSIHLSKKIVRKWFSRSRSANNTQKTGTSSQQHPLAMSHSCEHISSTKKSKLQIAHQGSFASKELPGAQLKKQTRAFSAPVISSKKNIEIQKPLIGITRAAISRWDVEQVGDWLDTISLSEHRECFQQEAIDGSALLQLTTMELIDLGITKLGDKMRIRGIRTLKKL